MIKSRLQGVDNARKIMSEAIARGRNLRPLLVEIDEILYDEVMQNFAAHGRPKWRPLAKSTRRRYAKKGYLLEPTLDRSPAGLVASIQTFIEEAAAGLSTNKPYAALHNFGGEIRRHPFSSTVRLRTDAQGNLLRQTDHGNLAVFASRRHKRATERRFTSSGFTIRIPQREFFMVGQGGIGRIEDAAAAFIGGV